MKSESQHHPSQEKQGSSPHQASVIKKGNHMPLVANVVTIKDVEQMLERVEEAAEYDDEVAHGREDKMYITILQAIANGSCEDPKRCAEIALKARDLDFARWCA